MAVSQLFKSTDLNMPRLSGQTGALIDVLKALLKDGAGKSGIAVTGITRSGSTATATLAAADVRPLRTGMYCTFSGANQSEYNITAQITVASTTTVTYTVSGTPTTPATGTILCSSLLPVTTITNVGTTATVTMPVSDSTLVAGQYVKVSGCTGGDASLYNGDQKIVSVISPTSFTYTMTGTPSGSATGTIFYTRAPLGWDTPFASGTNSLVFRSPNVTTNRYYLQVIDNGATAGGAKEAQVYGAVTMTADQTVSAERFPTTAQQSNGLCWRKSTSADTTAREYALWGDDRFFYIIIADSVVYCGGGFGHFFSDKPGDAYNTFIAGCATFNSASSFNGLSIETFLSAPAAASLYAPRASSQAGTSVMCANYLGMTASSTHSPGSMPNSGNTPSGQFWTVPVYISDAASTVRGRMPALYGHLHGQATFNQYDTLSNIVDLSGVTLTILSISEQNTTYQLCAETFGPFA